mmetsp:Transcript_9614/g.14451  ORF Transcript_9614/g.14451 Transcript_9614/m.14451 type:complete len:121 (+) Transcript_9614:163-525(+)
MPCGIDVHNQKVFFSRRHQDCLTHEKNSPYFDDMTTFLNLRRYLLTASNVKHHLGCISSSQPQHREIAMLSYLASKIHGKENPNTKENFYDLVDKNMDGEEVSMSDFKGSVLLLVNVASH